MSIPSQYSSYRKPSWAPPSWLFGPVWTVLYAIIAVSFGYVGYLWLTGAITLMITLPFLLNLLFNLLFTPLQFTWRNRTLAAVDIMLVWLTLVWAMTGILHIVPWVAYSNIPYLAWVTFATILQLTITILNRAR